MIYGIFTPAGSWYSLILLTNDELSELRTCHSVCVSICIVLFIVHKLCGLFFFEALVVLLEWVAGCMFADIEVTNMISSVHMGMVAVVTCMVACFGDLSWYS